MLALARRLDGAAITGVVELVPTFRSLMVHYDPLQLPHAELRARGSRRCSRASRPPRAPAGAGAFPACYDASLGLDLAEVAERTGLQPAPGRRAPQRHGQLVYMMGFLPGLPYLGGLPPRVRAAAAREPAPEGAAGLHRRRHGHDGRSTRWRAPAAGTSSARTPVPLWDMRRTQPALLAAGDKVTFAPVSLREYEATAGQGRGRRAATRAGRRQRSEQAAA